MTQSSGSVGARFNARRGDAGAAAALSWPPPAQETGPTDDVVEGPVRESLTAGQSPAIADEDGAQALQMRAAAAPVPVRHGVATILLLLLAIGEAVVIAWQMVTTPAAGTPPLDPPVAAAANGDVAGPAARPPVLAVVAERIDVPPVGQLDVSTTGSGEGVVIVDGERRGITPLTIRGLPSGQHDVVLVVDGRSIQHSIAIQSNGTTSLLVPVVPAPAAPGWVTVSMPFEVRISEDSELVGTSGQERLQFAPGIHQLVLSNEAIGYRTIEIVSVRSRQVTTVQPRVPTGTLSVNAQPWADVWIDGRPLGSTPLGNIDVPVGSHEIRFRHPVLGEALRRVLVTASEPARVSVDMRP